MNTFKKWLPAYDLQDSFFLQFNLVLHHHFPCYSIISIFPTNKYLINIILGSKYSFWNQTVSISICNLIKTSYVTMDTLYNLSIRLSSVKWLFRKKKLFIVVAIKNSYVYSKLFIHIL